MNIHKSQLFWGSLGTRILTHPHIFILYIFVWMIQPFWIPRIAGGEHTRKETYLFLGQTNKIRWEFWPRWNRRMSQGRAWWPLWSRLLADLLAAGCLKFWWSLAVKTPENIGIYNDLYNYSQYGDIWWYMYIIIYIHIQHILIYIYMSWVYNQWGSGWWFEAFFDIPALKWDGSFFARRGANQELVVYNVASNFVQNVEIQCEAQRPGDETTEKTYGIFSDTWPSRTAKKKVYFWTVSEVYPAQSHGLHDSSGSVIWTLTTYSNVPKALGFTTSSVKCCRCLTDLGNPQFWESLPDLAQNLVSILWISMRLDGRTMKKHDFLYPLRIKHGLLENLPFIQSYDFYKPPSQPCLMTSWKAQWAATERGLYVQWAAWPGNVVDVFF